MYVPAEKGPFAQAGIIVESYGIPLDNIFFGYDKKRFANQIFGKLECDEILKFAKKNDDNMSILNSQRDGLSWDHDFLEDIKIEVQRILDNIFKKLDKEHSSEKSRNVSKQLKQKNEKVIDALNRIAKQELEDSDDGTIPDDDGGPNPPYVPSNGHGFVPDLMHIINEKKTTAYFRVRIPDIGNEGDKVKISTDSEYLKIYNDTVELFPKDGYPNVGEAKVEIEGTRIGEICSIKAEINGYESELVIEITAKKETKPSKPRKKRSGLFKDIVFDPKMPPEQRLSFIDGVIRISTNSPSVKIYFGPNGEERKEQLSLVFLADMITEALCSNMVETKYDRGLFLELNPSYENYRFRQNEMQSKYADLIHKIYIPQERV
jgi:hypothetical protein